MGSIHQQMLKECLLGTGHVKLADIVNGEVRRGVRFRVGEVNPRPLNESHYRALYTDLGHRNVFARKYPMVGCVRKGDILNVGALLGTEYNATSTIPVVEFSEKALGDLIILLGGQHRYQAAMDILVVLVAEYGVKSVALDGYELKVAQYDEKVAKATLAQTKGGAKAVEAEVWNDRLQEMLEQQSEMWKQKTAMTEDLELLRTAIREIRFWPITFYLIGE